MCQVFGCVAPQPVDIRHELLLAPNPLIRRSDEHDSGWGIAVYEALDGGDPLLLRFPHGAAEASSLGHAAELSGHIFNLHVRRATTGGPTLENTHPFALGAYSFGHHGTLSDHRGLDPGDVEEPDAERLVGDQVLARAQIVRFREGVGLRGAERGDFAARRAARLAAIDRC